MASKRYVTICLWCGRQGTRRQFNNGPTINPPAILGKCPSSPDGKHKPRWQDA